jgi:hypothetical protein
MAPVARSLANLLSIHISWISIIKIQVRTPLATTRCRISTLWILISPLLFQIFGTPTLGLVEQLKKKLLMNRFFLGSTRVFFKSFKGASNKGVCLLPSSGLFHHCSIFPVQYWSGSKAAIKKLVMYITRREYIYDLRFIFNCGPFAGLFQA